MSTYFQMRMRQQKEVNEFPLGFAFNEKQFEEMMKKWGFSPNDTDKICRLPAGGFIQKKDLEVFHEMNKRHMQEISEAIAADKTGDGFIFEMFYCELLNHEYGYTGEVKYTLNELGYAYGDLQEDERLLHGFERARMKIIEDED